MKIKVEIDTDDLFDYTSSKEDEEIAKEILPKASNEALIDEVVDRKLGDDVFAQLSKEEQISIISYYAEDYGFVREQE